MYLLRYAAVSLLILATTGCAMSGPRFAVAGNDGQIGVRRLITPDEYQQLGEHANPDFDVDAHGRVVMGFDKAIYVLDPSEDGVHIAALALATSAKAASAGVAIDGDRGLLIHDAGSISAYYDGGVRILIHLDADGEVAHIAAATDAREIYLYGSRRADVGFQRRIVELTPDGMARSIVEADDQVTAATAAGGVLYFATATDIYRWSGDNLQLIIRLPDNLSVQSIAVDGNTLFFATADEVYALKGLAAVTITRGLGGSIRAFGGELYVLDDRRHLLVALNNIDSL